MILSISLKTPKGLFEPVWCRKSKWIITSLIKINGIRKWSAKNRVRVALSTANPPHSQPTISSPKIGIAENKFVMTVAPQNDIWPQGRTYPKKAAAIVANRMTNPTLQVIINKYDLKYTPRPIWRYNLIKKNLAPFAWVMRKNQP